MARIADRVPVDVAALLGDDEIEAMQYRAAALVRTGVFPADRSGTATRGRWYERDDGDDALDRLIHDVDLDGLVRLIDARCSSGDWAGLLRLRDRCAAATRETGRQLWPAATLAEYRLALLAPAEWAATVLDGEAGRFTIGPLSEVVAGSITPGPSSPRT